MSSKILIFYTIYTIIFFFGFDCIFIRCVAKCCAKLEDERMPDNVGEKILGYFGWFALFAFAQAFLMMVGCLCVELNLEDLNFIPVYLKSSFHGTIVFSNVAIVVAIIACLNYKRNWLLTYRLLRAEKREKVIKSCLKEVKEEIDDITRKLQEASGTHKERLQESLQMYKIEEEQYKTRNVENQNLQAKLRICRHERR